LDKVSKYTLLGADNSTILRQTKYFYDNKLVGLTKGDLTKKEDWLDDESGNPTTTYTYDEFGNLYQETDSLGRTTTRDYGTKDNTNTYPDRITNELGHAIDYNYDLGTGNIIDYTKHGVKFLYEYDTFGRIKKDISVLTLRYALNANPHIGTGLEKKENLKSLYCWLILSELLPKMFLHFR
jgi:YD repeat-containing protein